LPKRLHEARPLDRHLTRSLTAPATANPVGNKPGL
jgi:hypothetical protein